MSPGRCRCNAVCAGDRRARRSIICGSGLLRIGGCCRGTLGGECERRAEHRHCGRKRGNRNRGWFENSRNLCMCHGHTLCCAVTRSHWHSANRGSLARLGLGHERCDGFGLIKTRFDEMRFVAMEVVAGPTRSRPPLCRKSCLCASFRLFGIWSCLWSYRSSSAHWPSHRLWVIRGLAVEDLRRPLSVVSPIGDKTRCGRFVR